MRLTQAQIDAVKALENQRGEITPQQVVDAAKDKSSPLHELFEWNKSEAAAKWWLHQARIIIGAVTIQVHTQEYTYKAPAYVRNTEAEGAGYRATTSLKSDPVSARESLIYTLEVASGHLRRAFDIASPLGLSSEIDSLLTQIAGVKRAASERAAA